jgi:glucose dehydrogenase
VFAKPYKTAELRTGKAARRQVVSANNTNRTGVSSTPRDSRLFALDARTGVPCKGFGDNGTINLREGVADQWPKGRYEASSPPAVYKDLVIIGAGLQEFPSKGPSGAVRAFDVLFGNGAPGGTRNPDGGSSNQDGIRVRV